MQRRVMHKALAATSLTGTDIGFVHAHATSTPLGDRLEAGAIAGVMGEQVPVTSTKSMTGHTLGAAGAIGAVVTLQALRTGLLPGTLNCENPDPAIGLNITKQSSTCTGAAAITNAFGFGGHSVSLVITAS